MGIKYNPFRKKYQYYDEDNTEVYNPYTREYDVGIDDDAEVNRYSGKYVSKKSNKMCEKYNPYTMQYELVPCDWEIKFNPYTNQYEFAPKE